MKRKILTLLFFGAVSLISAQSKFDIRAYGGVGLVGLSSQKDIMTINGLDYKHNITTSPMFQGGVAASIGERFYVQPGITWQSFYLQSIKTETFGNKNKFQDDYNLTLITVPLKVGFKLFNPETFKHHNVRLFGGLDGQIVTAVDHKKVSNLNELKKEDFNTLITYAEFGLGVDVWFLFADVGYRIGLNPVLNSGDNSKPHMLYANAGIKIHF